MTQIKPLGPRELKQVLSLLTRFSEVTPSPILAQLRALYWPLHALNRLLPLRWSFLPGIYVAVTDETVIGLVWMSPDGYTPKRWKLEHVLIDPQLSSGFDVGKQLLDYVLHQYGAKGVETFLATVALEDQDGMALLKAAGFRHGAKLLTYERQGAIDSPTDLPNCRELRAGDGPKLQALYAETLLPEVRVSLARSAWDLSPPWFETLARMLRGEFYKRWVIPHVSGEYFLGSVAIQSSDYKQFTISIQVSPAWEHLAEPLVAFAVSQCAKSSQQATMTVHAYPFQAAKCEALSKLGFSAAQTMEVLIRDYWVSLDQQREGLRNPVLLFAPSGRTSPA